MSVIKYPSRMSQNISFDNLRLNGFTPSDIDIAYEVKGTTFIFGEIKKKGVNVPTGQSLLLKHIAKGLKEAGKNIMLFVAEHDTQVYEDVDAGSLSVRYVYFTKDGAEYRESYPGYTVQELCNKFLQDNNAIKV